MMVSINDKGGYCWEKVVIDVNRDDEVVKKPSNYV